MKADLKKSEYMTSLSGNQMVCKTHGRIAFRGKIDILEAEVIEAQVLASQLDEKEFCAYLEEILGLLRSIMSAEVKETPLPPPYLFGMDAEEIHRKSHNAGGKTLVLPSFTQGPLAARLNSLRAKVRETELLAVKEAPRDDIVFALNRLSSALWWLYCHYIKKRVSGHS